MSRAAKQEKELQKLKREKQKKNQEIIKEKVC